MKPVLILVFAALALGATPALAKNNGCPPGLAKKNPPCVPPGLAKKGVTTEEYTGRRYEDDDHDDDDDHHHHRYDDDDHRHDRDDYVYDRDDLPRYLIRPNGRVIDLEEQGEDGWRLIEGITDEDGMPLYVMNPNGRIFRVDDRRDDGWHLVDADDIVRLPRREDGREFYLLDDEVVEIINRRGDPYLRLLGALDDILN